MLTTNSSKFNARLGLLAAALAFGSPLVPAAVHAAPAASKTATYIPGSAEQKEMIDALRESASLHYHTTLPLEVWQINAANGYTYLTATTPDAEGNSDDSKPLGPGVLSALYQKQNGHWTLLKWSDCTDYELVDYCRVNYPDVIESLYPHLKDSIGPDFDPPIHTPRSGTPEREEIMTALRGSFDARYHKTVTFTVQILKVSNGYAYLEAIAVDANGKPIVGKALTDADVAAFYHKKNGRWTLVKWQYGKSLGVADYGEKYGPRVPYNLFD